MNLFVRSTSSIVSLCRHATAGTSLWVRRLGIFISFISFILQISYPKYTLLSKRQGKRKEKANSDADTPSLCSYTFLFPFPFPAPCSNMKMTDWDRGPTLALHLVNAIDISSRLILPHLLNNHVSKELVRRAFGVC